MQSSEMRSPYRLSVMDHDGIEQAITGLVTGFVWDSTQQGEAYWKGVYNALLAIQAQANMIAADQQPCLPTLS